MKYRLKLLYFSRGRGHGHALTDLAIAKELTHLCPDINLSFASYGSGLSTFRSLNAPVHSMNLPENNPFLPTLIESQRLIRALLPDIVVTNEEFAALPAANWNHVPSVFISDWLPRIPSIQADSL